MCCGYFHRMEIFSQVYNIQPQGTSKCEVKQQKKTKKKTKNCLDMPCQFRRKVFAMLKCLTHWRENGKFLFMTHSELVRKVEMFHSWDETARTREFYNNFLVEIKKKLKNCVWLMEFKRWMTAGGGRRRPAIFLSLNDGPSIRKFHVKRRIISAHSTPTTFINSLDLDERKIKLLPKVQGRGSYLIWNFSMYCWVTLTSAHQQVIPSSALQTAKILWWNKKKKVEHT